jgi:hypothetical protein
LKTSGTPVPVGDGRARLGRDQRARRHVPFPGRPERQHPVEAALADQRQAIGERGAEGAVDLRDGALPVLRLERGAGGEEGGPRDLVAVGSLERGAVQRGAPAEGGGIGLLPRGQVDDGGHRAAVLDHGERMGPGRLAADEGAGAVDRIDDEDARGGALRGVVGRLLGQPAVVGASMSRRLPAMVHSLTG